MNCFSILCLVLISVQNSIQENDILPAIPLVVKTPYLNTWALTRELPGNWPRFWNGDIKGLTGMVRVDGLTYEFMGNPTQDPIDTKLAAKQTGLKVTPTQTIFNFTAGAVELTVNFFTPIDPTDLKRLSLPASYIAISARSLDSKTHDIDVYIDITGEWTSGDAKQVVEWSFDKIGEILNHNLFLKTQSPLQEIRDSAQWGTIMLFTDSSATHEANNVTKMRSTFVKNGVLDNTTDNHFRPINDNYPGVAFAHKLTAGAQKSPNVYFGIAHVRRPAISYTVGEYKQLWEDFFGGDSHKMIEFFFNEREDALKRANELDTRVMADARKVGGESYVKVVSAALRQAYAGIELVGTQDKPWYMLKEISSDGNCQTVDVLYPHFAVQLYMNPKLLKLLLEPLLDNQERGFFPHNYSMHDLGSHYPRCIGHKDGKEEAMEVEESSNMLIMMAAYVKHTNDKDFAEKHYKISKQWAQYCVDHGLITGEQLTTDDFLGRIKNSTNLSVKAIIGIAAMAQLSATVGNHNDDQHYRQIAEKYVTEWIRLGEDPSGKHMKLSYNTPNSWFMIYNVYADILLDTKLIPERIYKQQDEWYKQVAVKYGIPLRNGTTQSKTDWVFYTAASSTDAKLRQLIFDRTALYLRESQKHVPFSDWIDVVSGGSPGFINRPAIGAVFAPLIIKH